MATHPSAELQAANLADFGLEGGSPLPPQEDHSDLAAEPTQATQDTQPAANAHLLAHEKKLMDMQQTILDQNQRHQQKIQILRAARTALPPSMAGASSAAASGTPPPLLQPDANWQADFADIDVDWGDMDLEQLNKLKTDKNARTAFLALWQQPKNKKIRKYDPVAQTTNQVDNYNSGSSTDHTVSDISDTFSEDPALLDLLKRYHSTTTTTKEPPSRCSPSGYGTTTTTKELIRALSRNYNNKGNSIEMLAFWLWNENHHTMLFTLIIAALAFSEATQQWAPPDFPNFC